MISYAPFWETLQRKNITTYALREKHNISPNTLTRMKNNKYLSMRTIEDFCKILNCRLEDIAEYIPDKQE
jgi:DNA-binding Xre family transcriptional regulator